MMAPQPGANSGTSDIIKGPLTDFLCVVGFHLEEAWFTGHFAVGSETLGALVRLTILPILHKVVLGREVAAESGLSMTARHEAAATDQRDPQVKEAESSQHVGLDLEVT